MPISTTKPEGLRTSTRRAFTLVELMVAATLCVLIVTGVMESQLHLIRSGIQISRHAEMESQVRKGLEQFGVDLRRATAVVWNGTSDITLTVPAIDGTTTQITYAWTASSMKFFSVPGASSAASTGKIILVAHIPALADGSPGLRFTGYDNNGSTTASNLPTKRIQVSLTVLRNTPSALPPVSFSASAGFILRNKTVF